MIFFIDEKLILDIFTSLEFIERLDSLLLQKKLVHSMAELWKNETKRRKARTSSADPDISPFSLEKIVSISADPQHSQAGVWIH